MRINTLRATTLLKYVGSSGRHRKNVARHEAAHALVASVVEVPFHNVWIDGTGGGVTLSCPPHLSTAEDIYNFIHRKIIILLAGVVGEKPGLSRKEALRHLEYHKDLADAVALAWVSDEIASNPKIWEAFLDRLIETINTQPWQSAIDEVASALVEF